MGEAEEKKESQEEITNESSRSRSRNHKTSRLKPNVITKSVGVPDHARDDAEEKTTSENEMWIHLFLNEEDEKFCDVCGRPSQEDGCTFVRAETRDMLRKIKDRIESRRVKRFALKAPGARSESDDEDADVV